MWFAVMLVASVCLRPPALATSGDPFAALIEDVLAASHRDEGGATEARDWQDRKVRWQAAAIPLRMARTLSGSAIVPERADILIELQLETLARILRDEPGLEVLQPSLERLRRFLRDGRAMEHVEAAVADAQRAYQQAYAAFRLSYRRWRMRQDFEAGRPWRSR